MRHELVLPPGSVGQLNYRARVGSMTQGHSHNEIEFNLVTDGEAAYFLEGHRYPLRRNTMVWLFPGQDHILKVASNNFRMWLGVFNAELLLPQNRGDLLTAAPANPLAEFCRVLTSEQASGLIQVFTQVERCAGTGLYDAGLRFTAPLAWKTFQESQEAPSGSAVHRGVEETARLIQSGEDGSIELLAAQVGLTAPYLSALFANQVGMPINRFRNQHRLQRFIEIYGVGKRTSILDAALEAGFGSYPQFHRVFKEAIGCSPAAYRRRISGG